MGFGGGLAAQAAQRLGLALQPVEGNGVAAVGAAAEAGGLEPGEGVVQRLQLGQQMAVARLVQRPVGVVFALVVRVVGQQRRGLCAGKVGMDELFAVTHDSEVARNPLGSTWAKQCYAFVHWCLYGEQGKNQRGFLTLLARLSKEPMSESLFKECFKQSYKDMGLTMRGYVEFTNYKMVGLRTPKGEKIPEPPPVTLREATEGEIGRIKGETLRLAGHDATARLAMIAPYVRGERDPGLLASIGLALVLQECAILAWGPLGDNVPPPDALNGVVIWGGFVYPKYRLFVIGFTATPGANPAEIAGGITELFVPLRIETVLLVNAAFPT